MAIIFVGSSLSDVSEISDSPAVSTTTAHLDTNVVEGISIPGNTDHSFGITFDSQSEIWLSFHMRWAAVAGGPKQGIQFKAGVTELFRFNGHSNSGNSALSYHNGTSLQTNVVTGGDYAGVHRVDIHIKMADTGGIFEVYKDGVLDINLSSITTDTLRTAATGLDRITFSTYSLGSTTFSAIVIATEDTRGFKVVQQLPSGAGATSQWSGAYTSLDETGINDGDSISSSVIGEVSTFAFPAIPTDFDTSAWAVKAVVAGLRVVATPEEDIDVAGVVRTASTNYETAALDAKPAYNGRQAIWEVNPNTATEWTYTDASAAQVGVKTVA